MLPNSLKEAIAAAVWGANGALDASSRVEAAVAAWFATYAIVRGAMRPDAVITPTVIDQRPGYGMVRVVVASAKRVTVDGMAHLTGWVEHGHLTMYPLWARSSGPARVLNPAWLSGDPPIPSAT